MSSMAVYDISSMLKADEIYWFHADPSDRFIFSPDVLGDRCHNALWFAVPKVMWDIEIARFKTMDPENFAKGFDKQAPRLLIADGYEIFKEQTWMKLRTCSYNDSDGKNMLLTLCVLHKILNPESKVGLACEERCGKNILDSYKKPTGRVG